MLEPDFNLDSLKLKLNKITKQTCPKKVPFLWKLHILIFLDYLFGLYFDFFFLFPYSLLMIQKND